MRPGAPEFDSLVSRKTTQSSRGAVGAGTAVSRESGMPMPPQDDALERLGRILVIDDEPDVVEVVSVYFSGSGYEVVGATQAGDGLMLADIHRPDLVLLDIMMP